MCGITSSVIDTKKNTDIYGPWHTLKNKEEVWKKHTDDPLYPKEDKFLSDYREIWIVDSLSYSNFGLKGENSN